MVWKRLGVVGGSALLWGGQDLDKISALFAGIADVDTIDINSNWTFRNGRLRQRNPLNTFSLIHNVGALTADRNVNWPALTADDIPTFNDFIATFKNKTIVHGSNGNSITGLVDASINAHTSTKITITDRTHLPTLAAYLDTVQAFTAIQKFDTALKLKPVAAPTTDAVYGQFYPDSADSNKPKFKKPDGTVIDLSGGGGGGGSALVQPYDFFIYKSGSNYIAINGVTNALDYTNTSFYTVITSVISVLSGGGTILLGAGDFTLTSQFTCSTSKIHIRGLGQDITRILYGMGATVSGFTVSGSVGTVVNLTANAIKGAHTLTVGSGHGLVTGDWIFLRRLVTMDSGPGNEDRYDAEIHKVLSVTSTVITLEDTIYEAYNTADSAQLYEISWVRGFELEDLTLYDNRGSVSGLDAADTIFSFCYNLRIRNVKFENMVYASCGIRNCFNTLVSTLGFESPRELSGGGGIRYGLYILAATTNLVLNGAWAQRCRHSLTTNNSSGGVTDSGRPRNISINGFLSFNADTAGFDTHESTVGISFNGCGALNGYPGNVTATSKGFNTRGPATFNSCWVEGAYTSAFTFFSNADLAGTDTQPGADRTIMNACRVNNTSPPGGTNKGVVIAANRSSISINNCQFYNIEDANVEIEDGVKNVIITGCIFHNAGSGLGSSTGIIRALANVDDLIVTNNIFGAGTPSASGRPLSVGTSVDRLIFKDNDCNGLTNKQPTITAASTDVTMTDNLTLNPIGKVTNFANNTNNTIGSYGGTTTTVVASTDYTIVGGTMFITSTGGTGVSITAKDVAGNTITSGDTSLTIRTYVRGWKINFGAFSVAPTVGVFSG